MAGFTALPAKLSFRLETGQTKPGTSKYIQKTLTLSNINPEKPVGDLAAVSEALMDVMQYQCSRVTLTRLDVVEL